MSANSSQAMAIALSQVSKTYPTGLVALQGVDLAIAPGEFVSLVGPSGCGKSTVLKLIAGLGQPTSGSIQWHQSRKPKLAFVFQDAALMPWATVSENVRLPLKLAGVSKSAALKSVTEVLELVGLSEYTRAYPRELSGGMKMRVSIARALVTQPDVLLMDEPFGALDDITRGKLNRELLALWERYRWTVAFVTHNIYEAVYLSNRVVVMAAAPGRMVAEVAIAASYPRTDEFRTSVSFTDYCRQVSAHLSEAAESLPSARTRWKGAHR